MNVELTVAFVGFGGNAAEGEYFFSYSPNVILIEKKDVTVNIVFSPETGEQFEMQAFLTSDDGQEFGARKFSSNKRSVEVLDRNTRPQLIQTSVLVRDTGRNRLISCDPQVLNIPDTHD